MAITKKDIGISEWNTKCLVLSKNEQLEVLKALKDGTSTHLLEIVKLPFPKFIREYFLTYYEDELKSLMSVETVKNSYILVINKYINYKTLLTDPSIGYRIYMLSDATIEHIVHYIKGSEANLENQSCTNTKYKYNNDIIEFFTYPLDELYKLIIWKKRCSDEIAKYIHILQYVDANEAECLGLKSLTFYDYVNQKYRGFDLVEKLDSLNPLIKRILIKYIGLDGINLTQDEIEDLYNLGRILNYLINKDFLLNLCQSLKSFQNSIGYIDKAYENNQRKEYSSKKKYKKIFENLEFRFVYNNMSEEEIQSMAIFPKTGEEARTYLKENAFEHIDELIEKIESLAKSDSKELNKEL